MATLRSLIVTDLVTAAPEESVSTVAIRMAQNRIGAVLIVDRDQLVGVVTERDLLTRIIAKHFDPDTTGIGDVKTSPLTTIDVNEPIKAALAIFRTSEFRHLPVLEDGKPIGILSTTDLHAYLLEGFERFVDDLKYQKSLAEGLDPYDHFGGQYNR